jgi:hypothetical protein
MNVKIMIILDVVISILVCRQQLIYIVYILYNIYCILSLRRTTCLKLQKGDNNISFILQMNATGLCNVGIYFPE